MHTGILDPVRHNYRSTGEVGDDVFGADDDARHVPIVVQFASRVFVYTVWVVGCVLRGQRFQWSHVHIGGLGKVSLSVPNRILENLQDTSWTRERSRRAKHHVAVARRVRGAQERYSSTEDARTFQRLVHKLLTSRDSAHLSDIDEEFLPGLVVEVADECTEAVVREHELLEGLRAGLVRWLRIEKRGLSQTGSPTIFCNGLLECFCKLFYLTADAVVLQSNTEICCTTTLLHVGALQLPCIVGNTR